MWLTEDFFPSISVCNIWSCQSIESIHAISFRNIGTTLKPTKGHNGSHSASISRMCWWWFAFVHLIVKILLWQRWDGVQPRKQAAIPPSSACRRGDIRVHHMSTHNCEQMATQSMFLPNNWVPWATFLHPANKDKHLIWDKNIYSKEEISTSEAVPLLAKAHWAIPGHSQRNSWQHNKAFRYTHLKVL